MLVFTYKRYGEFGDQVEVPSNRQIAEPSKLIFYTIPHFDKAFVFLTDSTVMIDYEVTLTLNRNCTPKSPVTTYVNMKK